MIKKCFFFGACALILILSACTPGNVNPEKNMQVLIDNMRSNAYDFKGELHAQVNENTLEEVLVLDGTYVPEKGYSLHANVSLPGFETESDILKVDDQLYYKLPKSNRWKATTDQDLRMLGIMYNDSPADLFRGMKEMVLSVEPTEANNVFEVTLDRSKYAEATDQEGIMRLPEVNIQSQDLQLQLMENPIMDVEVDLERNLIRGLTLNYVVKTSLDGQSEQPMTVTYEMRMKHFNEDQTLPEI